MSGQDNIKLLEVNLAGSIAIHGLLQHAIGPVMLLYAAIRERKGKRCKLTSISRSSS
jgi:hypothetical protein